MTLQALLDNGDQVLIPAPDYPLWTASTALAGGTPVHYLCDETQGWMPDIADMESKITDRTKALVVINPNNPTGAVYSREILEQIAELARKHQLLLLADEIYDKILYDDAEHIAMASVAPDLLCLTFNGLSKAYRVAGYRSGWLVDHRPQGAREPASSRASTCCPTCGCARMCLRSTPFRWRSADIRASTTWCCPAAGCSNSATSPGTSSTRSPGCPASSRGRAVRVPAPRSRGARHPRRRAAGARPAAAGEDPGDAGHRIQLARTRSPAHRDAAVGARPRQRDRAAGQLPGELPPVAPPASQGPPPAPLPCPGGAFALALHVLRSGAARPAGGQDRRRPARRDRRRRHRRAWRCCGRASRASTSRCRSRTRRAARSPPSPATSCPARTAACGSPSAGAVLTSAPDGRPAGRRRVRAVARRDRLGPEQGRQHAAGVQRRSRPAEPRRRRRRPDQQAGRPERHHDATPSSTSSAPGRWSHPGRRVRDRDRRGRALARAARDGRHRRRVRRADGLPAARAARRRPGRPRVPGGVGGDPVRGHLPGARGEPAHQRRAARHADRRCCWRPYCPGRQSNWRT